MKQEIPIPSKYGIVLLTIFLIGVIIDFFYFRKNYLHYKKDVSNLISRKIDGRISDLKNMSRGSYFLKIGDYEINGLPIGYEIRKYNIQVGDSVSKEANSQIMFFYKNKNGIAEKHCEYQIH